MVFVAELLLGGAYLRSNGKTSPNLYAPVGDDINTRHVGALRSGEEDCHVCDFFRSPEAIRQRLTIRYIVRNSAIRKVERISGPEGGVR